MSTLRISDAPLLPDVDGTEKIPTGGRGDYTISVDQIKDHIFQDIGKELVGLGNVDNTSDLDKPVSTAQQAALNLKANKTYVDTNLDLKADKTNVYTRSETSLALSKKADLVNGVVPENQIPSSFNDVLEFTTTNLPIVGESGKIYVTTDNNKTWRWSGNKYVEISGWNPDSVSKRVTLPTYFTKETGVDPVTGVAGGDYFNVRSTDDDTMLVEYQNVGGVPTQTGKSYPSAQAIVEVQQTVATVDEKLKRENVSVWDFFTDAEIDAYKASPATFDAYTQVQAFFDYVRDNDVGTAHNSGDFATSRGLVFGDGTAVGIKTKNLDGIIILRALTAIDIVLDLRIGERKNWNGGAVVYGTGGTTYTSRTCRAGIYVGSRTERCNITRLEANNFYEVGVYAYSRSTLDNIGSVVCRDCGSGKKSANYSLLANYTAINTGSASSAAQRSTLTVTALPPENLATQVHVIINDQPHYVYSVDRVNSKLEVYPWVDSNLLTGQLIYLFGGGVHLTGGDTSELHFGLIDATRCSIGFNGSSLYGAFAGELTVQACAVGVSFGAHPAGAVVGGVIGNLYCELNDADILVASSALSKINILSTKGFNTTTGIRYVAARNASNQLSTTYARMAGISINGDYFEKSPSNGIDASSTINFNIFKQNAQLVTRKNTTAIALTADIDGLNALYGYDSGLLTVIGTTPSGTPTGTVTFTPPSGATVNGEASAVFSGFSGVARFIVYYQVAANNFIVLPISNLSANQASVTYDPPSLAGGDSVTTTVTLSGASVGDIVQAAFSRYNADIEISAQVSASNTVTVKFKNTSAAPIDLASGTLKVKLV